MCGIVGYTGLREAEPLLIQGLKRLEYRGYDSAGVCTLAGRQLHLRKCAGRLAQLQQLLAQKPAPGCHGIGHTRWATHGPAVDSNAHPHFGGNGELALVHNGVIENYVHLRDWLERRGIVFNSDTDSEAIAHLLAYFLNGSLLEAVCKAVGMLKGTFALAVISQNEPEVLIGARMGSPLVLGLGGAENYLASDAAAFLGWTDRVVYLEDRQIVAATANEFRLLDFDSREISTSVSLIDWDVADADKGEHDHYMLKEILEQPASLNNAMRGRLIDEDATACFDGANIDTRHLRQADRIILTACGTSYHAALIGEYLLEQFARVPVEVEYASELRYRNPPINSNTLVIAISQSGETADTLAALRECRRQGLYSLAICNVVGSTIAREADGVIYLHAGPEIGVASTKAFTSQVLVLALLALYLGRIRHMSFLDGQRFIASLQEVPALVQSALDCQQQVEDIADRYFEMNNYLYLGRHYLYPLALEGALKLKEISYIHAEGYPAAEMKHGPIALVDGQTPSVFLLPAEGLFLDKIMGNLEEIRARRGPIIAVTPQPDSAILRQLRNRADEVIVVPSAPDFLQPLVSAVPLQMLAYHIALRRGCDVDKPRNLAKSVTVE